ncbi:15218_t:CDS:2 [Funneliformis caledonium]|uniref:15218_t:CDS:1 n=1 Tax=Funneliformis caledonium TaxID=1117310 RepID=A0A9N9N639_9GLOM|nr:15218_t:CDS:2 [Funneliformis caledonium]
MFIQIYEGKCAHTKDNNFFEEFKLSEIHPALKGVSQIEVIFDIDEKVSAADNITGISNNITIINDKD